MTTRARRKSSYLRGYYWDAGMARYKSAATGRIVSRVTILDKLSDSIAQREATVARHAQQLANGALNPSAYIYQQNILLKRQSLQEAALAAGGWDRLTPSDRGRVGALLQHDLYPALSRQAQDKLADKLSQAQATSRAHMMMGEVRALGYEVERAHQPPAPQGSVRIARRRLTADDRNCQGCIDLAGEGWQPEEDVPVPGVGAECGGNCRCQIETRTIPAGEIDQWVGQQYG